MIAHVLLNLLNKLGKRDIMRGLLSISLLFHNKFSKFNNTEAQMIESIYHMTLKLFCYHVFWCEKVNILPYARDIMSLISWRYPNL